MLAWPAFVVFVLAGWVLLSGAHLHAHRATSVPSAAVMVAAWALMSTMMMVPTAVPMLATLRSILRGRAPASWWMFLAGYASVWATVGALGAIVQGAARSAGVLEPGGLRQLGAAAVLALAGVYQFSGVKARCLQACTSPMSWFMAHWRDGADGAARMGLHHGLSCLGCCWALMSLALVGGLTSFVAMAAAAALMALEKLPRLGGHVRAPLGAALIAAAVVVALSAGGTSDAPHPTHNSNTTQPERGTDGTLVALR